MNTICHWWSECPPQFLNETIGSINSARERDDPRDRCEDLCKALNKLWNALFQYQKQRGQLINSERESRADWQKFTQLLLTGMSPDQQRDFTQIHSLRYLSEFEPRIMNHDTLLKEAYNPRDISDSLRSRASREHRQFANAYERLIGNPFDEDLQDALLKKSAQLLYIVRSNIAHGEKTPNGPDREKTKRDRAVSEVVEAVIDDLFDILFDYPSRRLAVYGTLAPGQPNASVLEAIEGSWSDGEVDGEIGSRDGFPLFTWRTDRDKSVNVKIFEAITLSDYFERRLDQFEGSSYRRILIPVRTTEQIQICNVYKAVG